MTNENPYPRHKIIKIDTLNYRSVIVAGAIIAAASILPGNEFFDPLAIRSLMFMAGCGVILSGIDLRTMYRRHADVEIERMLRKGKP